jgi:ankyrin repeat protein
VRAGSDLNLQNNWGMTALMIAARNGRSDVTTILLEGKQIDLDIQEHIRGWSALHFAAGNGDWATTHALVNAGANFHLKDKNGKTALQIAEHKSKDEYEPMLQPWSKHSAVIGYALVIALLTRKLKNPITSHSHHFDERETPCH